MPVIGFSGVSNYLGEHKNLIPQCPLLHGFEICDGPDPDLGVVIAQGDVLRVR